MKGNYRFYLLISIIIIIFFGFIFYFTRDNYKNNSGEYFFNTNVQENIQNQIRILAKPISYSDHGIVVYFKAESFQNPEFIRTNLKDIILLIDEKENILDYIDWKASKKTKESYEGHLIFQKTPTIPKRLILTVFGLEERQFEWSF